MRGDARSGRGVVERKRRPDVADRRTEAGGRAVTWVGRTDEGERECTK